MSVQAALDFLRQARQDEQLQAELRLLLDSPPTISEQPETSPTLQLAARHGFIFTASDLQVAFRHDWRFRWLHFHAQRNSGA